MQQAPIIKEYLDIVFRRRWWIVIPAVLGLLFAIAAYFKMPKEYMAGTRVQTRPQAISEQLLRPIVDTDANELVTTITSEITSEQYVQDVDRELNLVGSPGGPRDLAELGRMLDRKIDLQPNPRARHFDLMVSWNDPRIAAAIANKLAAIYIDRFQELRKELATETLEQLTEERKRIEAQLAEVRERIERFRSEHKYALESYQTENQQLFDRHVARMNEIDRQIRELENQIATIDLRLELAPRTGGTAEEDPRRAELERLENELATTSLGPQHPDYVKLERRIERLRQELSGQAPSDDGGTGELAVAQLRQQRSSAQREIRVLRARRAELEQENRVIQARMERTPENQIELDAFQRLEDQLAQEYEQAKTKELDAKSGMLVEQFEKGERFAILNYARPPEKPYWPDFKLFVFMGLAVGLGLGASMVLLLEVFDQSFKSEEQLAASIDLPILAVIPDLNRVADQATRRSAARGRAPA